MKEVFCADTLKFSLFKSLLVFFSKNSDDCEQQITFTTTFAEYPFEGHFINFHCYD